MDNEELNQNMKNMNQQTELDDFNKLVTVLFAPEIRLDALKLMKERKE